MDTPSQKRVSKACDACKRRKVKCNGQERCQQCAHLGLRCVYSPSSKQRSQGRRGHVISEFRNQTANASAQSPPILPANQAQAAYPTPYTASSPSIDHHSSDAASPTSPSLPQYTKAFFLDLIPDYLEGVYPVQPVISEHELRQYIHVMDQEPEVRSFLYAFAGCTLNLARYGDRRTDEVVRTIEHLVDCSIETQKPSRRHFHFSVMRTMQSVYLHNCLMSLQAGEAAFMHLRDGISIIQLLRIDNPENMANLSPPERSRRQRLYWLSFIHERFVAVIDYRRVVLSPLYTMPEPDPTIPIQVDEGFNQIIKTFRFIDPEFLDSWLDSKRGSVTSEWVEAKSRELEGDLERDERDFANLSMMQRADLIITREWLRTLVWRLAMGKTLLSSRSPKECLSLLFPIRLSQTLRRVVSSMSREDIEVHGSSITQKLFEINDTIADVLIHVPAATLDETAQRIDDFLFTLDFVLLFPQLDQTRRGILLEKLERLQTMFPEAVSSASSPNLPLGPQSPRTNDSWQQVVTQVRPDIQPKDFMGSRPEKKFGQLATYNHISRRLSQATVGGM